MTPEQRGTVDMRKAEGFKVVEQCSNATRISKGADHRLVFRDGSEKRGYHSIRAK